MTALLRYPSEGERIDELARLAEAVDGELLEYGRSLQERPLQAVRVPALSAGPPEAVFLVCANIHGIEYISNRVAHGWLAYLATDQARPLRERAETWVAPCLNPDGYARTWAQDGRGRVRDMRKNAAGVDLNRNFPLPAGATLPKRPGGGGSDPDAATYRGTAPLSEPETRALAELLEQHTFRASVSLHSFMGTMIPPYVVEPLHGSAYRQLHRAFCRGQAHTRYWRLASRWFDTFTGELEDHQHHHRRCWSVCVETFPVAHSLRQHLRAPSSFWRFNPRDVERWVYNDVSGLAAYFTEALAVPPPPGEPVALAELPRQWPTP